MLTKNDLISKWWYRLIKVIYFSGYSLTFVIMCTIAIGQKPYTSMYGDNMVVGSWSQVATIFIIGSAVIALVFECIRRVFFYVVIGKTTNSGSQPDPILLGDFLCYEMMTDRFKMDYKSLSKGVPENIEPCMKGWLLIYSAWLFKNKVSELYGTTFADRMMAEVLSKLYKAESLKADMIGTAENFRCCFGFLDRLMSNAKKALSPAMVEALEMTLEQCAAYGFLLESSDSPYYKNKDVDMYIISSVGTSILSAREALEPYMDAIVKNHTKI